MSNSDQNQAKKLLVIGLIIFLSVVVGWQAWTMSNMKQQLDEIQLNAGSVQSGGNLSVVPSVQAQPTLPPSSHNSIPLQSQGSRSQGNTPQSKAPVAPRSLFDDDFFNTPFDSRTWNPYEEIQRMQRDMDRLFNQTFSRFNQSPDFQQFFNQGVTTPEMDVHEDDSQYTVIVNLPGAEENNISVKLDGQILTVEGKQDFSKQNKDSMGNVIFQERRSGSFQRSITLPEPVRESGMKTQVDNGVLTITIPKA